MRRVVAIALLTTVLTGCGDPYAGRDDRAPALPEGEQPAHPLPRRDEAVPTRYLAPTPEEAARRAARLATNWTGATAARNYAELSRMTVGDARRSAREAASRLPADPQLGDSSTRSRGTVAAIAARSTAYGRRELIVVTHERLDGDGLHETRWRVTLATAVRRRGGWALSRWEPQA